MAIQIYCVICRSSCSPDKNCPHCRNISGPDTKKCSNCGKLLDPKKCPKCGAVFGREKKYRVSVSVKGKRANRIVDNFTLAREVESALKGDLVRAEFNISDHRVQERVTLADVWKEYLTWAQQHKKTWDDDKYHYCKHLEPRFGSKALEDITPLDIERMKSELKKGIEKKLPEGRKPREKPYSPATIKHMIVLLNRLFNLARKWNLYNGPNPVSQVEKPKLDNNIQETLDDEELSRLITVLESWPCLESAAFVKFALFTGLRRGELFKLQWSDIDFDTGMLTLRAPKGGKTETIPISKLALKTIEDLGRKTSGYVFPGKEGQQRVEFKLPWQRIRKAAKLPENFRFHGLRHNFASRLVSNGVDLYTVGKLLTHKSTSTTQRYAHLADETLRQAALKSSRFLQPRSEVTGSENPGED